MTGGEREHLCVGENGTVLRRGRAKDCPVCQRASRNATMQAHTRANQEAKEAEARKPLELQERLTVAAERIADALDQIFIRVAQSRIEEVAARKAPKEK